MTVYMDYAKARLPDVEDRETAAFWEGTLQGEIRFRKCNTCHRFHWYPCVVCPFCHSSDISWQALNPQAKLFTWTYVRWDFGPLFNLHGPYIAALIEFDEAPNLRFATNLVDCKPEDLQIGMPLEVVFHRVNDKIVMPLFKPVNHALSYGNDKEGK